MRSASVERVDRIVRDEQSRAREPRRAATRRSPAELGSGLHVEGRERFVHQQQRRLGSRARARSATRCACPPDSVAAAGRRAFSPSPTRPSHAFRQLPGVAASNTPLLQSEGDVVSRGSNGQQQVVLEDARRRRRCSGGTNTRGRRIVDHVPLIRTWPSSIASRPRACVAASSFPRRSGPTMAHNSPSATCNVGRSANCPSGDADVGVDGHSPDRPAIAQADQYRQRHRQRARGSG